ncbi:MAG: hypothetical protein MHM6MM_001125 [Cercozoa sp. M6MM]
MSHKPSLMQNQQASQAPQPQVMSLLQGQQLRAQAHLRQAHHLHTLAQNQSQGQQQILTQLTLISDMCSSIGQRMTQLEEQQRGLQRDVQKLKEHISTPHQLAAPSQNSNGSKKGNLHIDTRLAHQHASGPTILSPTGSIDAIFNPETGTKRPNPHAEDREDKRARTSIPTVTVAVPSGINEALTPGISHVVQLGDLERVREPVSATLHPVHFENEVYALRRSRRHTTTVAAVNSNAGISTNNSTNSSINDENRAPIEHSQLLDEPEDEYDEDEFEEESPLSLPRRASQNRQTSYAPKQTSLAMLLAEFGAFTRDDGVAFGIMNKVTSVKPGIIKSMMKHGTLKSDCGDPECARGKSCRHSMHPRVYWLDRSKVRADPRIYCPKIKGAQILPVFPVQSFRVSQELKRRRRGEKHEKLMRLRAKHRQPQPPQTRASVRLPIAPPQPMPVTVTAYATRTTRATAQAHPGVAVAPAAATSAGIAAGMPSAPLIDITVTGTSPERDRDLVQEQPVQERRD